MSRRRGAYRSAYKHGISRVPRKALWSRGTQFGWVGAEVPGTVGGRRAHPPKAVKDHSQKVNKQERRFALRSALASGVAQNRVSVVQNVESLAKGADVAKLLSACHVQLPSRSIRAGRGKMRGRKYKTGLGPVFVVAADCPLKKSARNLSGVSVVSVRSLHAGQFMKDARVARHAVWSPEALAILTKEKLYL